MAASTELIQKNTETEKAEEQYHKDMDEAKKTADPTERSKKEDAAKDKLDEATRKAKKKYEEAKGQAAAKLKDFVNKQIEDKEKHKDKVIDLKPLDNMLALLLEAGTWDKAIYKPSDKCKGGNCPETTDKNSNDILCKNDTACHCECFVFVNIGGTEFRAETVIHGAGFHSCPGNTRLLFPVGCRCTEKT
jgi:hypothetical protein